MVLLVTLIIILIILVNIVVYTLVFKNIDYVYDLSHNRTCNLFELDNIDKLRQLIPICPNKMHIDNYLPEWIDIRIFPDKGWGLITKKAFKKDDIIYMVPILEYPNGGIEIISKTLGVKKIEKEIHCGEMEQLYNLFCCYDCFLNHNYNSSTYHDNLLTIKDGNIHVVLRASRNIDVGTELTINYMYLNEYVYYISSYVNCVYKHFTR